MKSLDTRLIPIALALTAIAVAGYMVGQKGTTLLIRPDTPSPAAAQRALQQGNDGEAFKMFSALSKQGNVTAEYRLGYMYEHGIGTAVDVSKATDWLTKAADAGNVDASRQLGMLYLNGLVTVQDFAKARTWLTAAAMAGDPIAAQRLGDMERDGLGAPPDPVAAYAWYEVAALRGDSYGVTLRDKLQGSLQPGQQVAGQTQARQIVAQIDSKTAAPAKAAATTPA